MTRILVCGMWDDGAGYPRTRSVLEALRTRGVELVEYRLDPPVSGAAKRRLLRRPTRWPGLAVQLWGWRRRFAEGLRAAVAESRPDAVLVPYPAHLVAGIVRRCFAGPIVADLFLSAYDTAVLDRGMFGPRSLPARALRWLDRRVVARADLALMDTPEHVAHVASLLRRNESELDWVPVSDPDAPAAPASYRAPESAGAIEVLFFGTGVPLHGTEHLIEAVAASPRLHLTLIGGTEAHRRLAKDRCGSRLRLLEEFVARDELQREIDRCHIVAGVFSDNGKARRVVPFKVVHALASGRPVVTADTPAVRRALSPGIDCVVCTPADADSIRESVFAIASPAEFDHMAAAARLRYERTFSEAAVFDRLEVAFARVGVALHGKRESIAAPEPELAEVAS